MSLVPVRWSLAVALAACCCGCYSPYRADRGALMGGVGGAGLGALVGEASGHPAVGALVGAAAGATTGAVIGGAIDQSEANNRALIEARMGRPAPVGAVTVQDVVSMSAAGVPEEAIVTHIRSHGVATPIQAGDLIVMQQQHVSPRVMQTLQTTTLPAPPGAVVVPAPGPPPVVYYPARPVYYGPPPYPY